VAAGEPLPLSQDEIGLSGHAVEARLYAENPASGFLPSIGRLASFSLPTNVRADAGVDEGDVISPFYDPMIAKLVAGGESREDAIGALASILDEIEVWPVKTNAGFLFNAILDEDFGSGRIDTGFIERKLDELVPDPEPDDALWRGAASVATARVEDEEPIVGLSGFRLNAPPRHAVALGRDGDFRTVDLDGDQPMAAVSGFRDEERVVAFYEGQAYEFELAARGNLHGHHAGDGAVEAPMPGRVTAVEVAAGQDVAKGDRLLTLEAMKMEHALVAPFDGVVAELNAKAGEQVVEGTILVRVESKETA